MPSPATDALPERGAPVAAHRQVGAVRVVGTDLELALTPALPVAWVGTDPGCDLRLSSRFVSARHCTLERDDRRVVCRDQRSTNGVWLGDRRVDSLEVEAEQWFRVGDQLLIGVSAEGQAVRRRIQTWLGHAERFQPAVDAGLRVAVDRGHAVITGASGGRGDALAHLLHDALATVPRPRVDLGASADGGPIDDRERQRALLDRARGGSLVIDASMLPTDGSGLRDQLAKVSTDVRLLVTAPAELVARACGLLPGAVVLEVPALAERRDDLARLVIEVAADIGRRRRWSPDLGTDLAALVGYPWPGNLDELEDSVERVLAVRATGSIRAAEDSLGVSKSAIGRTLKRLGLDRGQKLAR